MFTVWKTILRKFVKLWLNAQKAESFWISQNTIRSGKTDNPPLTDGSG